MRAIKFRGKSKIDGEWFYGYYCCSSEWTGTRTHHIIPKFGTVKSFFNYLVNGESVGQFTGLYDKNEKEIYEGDIVRKMCVKGYAGQYEDGEVVFRDGSFVIDTKDKWERFRYTTFDETEELNDGKCHWTDEYEFEVIGNIYDNPNLIKR